MRLIRRVRAWQHLRRYGHVTFDHPQGDITLNAYCPEYPDPHRVTDSPNFEHWIAVMKELLGP